MSARLMGLAVFRVFENHYYQYERGLFEPDQFGPRATRWQQIATIPAFREAWGEFRETFAPRFRTELDRIVAESGQAQ